MSTPLIFAALFIFNLSVFAALAVRGSAIPPQPRLARSLKSQQTIVPATNAREWTANTYFTAGETCATGGVVYVCLRPHTSREGIPPPAATNLWRAVRQQRSKRP